MNIEEIRKNAPSGATHYLYNINKTVYLRHVRANRYNHVLKTGKFGDTQFKTFGDIKPL